MRESGSGPPSPFMSNPKNLQPFDWHRLLIGETPWWFQIEILARVCFIYAVLTLAMRLMGKRVAGQMSLSEMAVLITLGAAVGVPMQVEDRGMFPAVIILLVALIFQRGLSLWAYRNRKVEVLSQGDVTVLLQDGRLFLDSMRAAVLSRERLFSMLRVSGIEHLGQVRRVYFETSGAISVFKLRTPKPGLSILPTFDDALRRTELSTDHHYASEDCGYVCESDDPPEECCKFCQTCRWTEAVVEVASLEEKSERESACDAK
jgi:uncharacterized membrane protein YcaP (DUF421 family)